MEQEGCSGMRQSSSTEPLEQPQEQGTILKSH